MAVIDRRGCAETRDGTRLTLRSGKQKQNALPPGIAKNLVRGKPLPTGIAKKALPGDLSRPLPPVRDDESLHRTLEHDLAGAHDHAAGIESRPVAELVGAVD